MRVPMEQNRQRRDELQRRQIAKDSVTRVQIKSVSTREPPGTIPAEGKESVCFVSFCTSKGTYCSFDKTWKLRKNKGGPSMGWFHA